MRLPRGIIVPALFCVLLPAAPAPAQTPAGDSTRSAAGSPARDTLRASARAAAPAVIVRYFHRTIRCSTCLNIEAVARSVVSGQYGGDTAVAFEAYNIDEPGSRAFVERFALTGSALYVCAGEDCHDLTKQAFECALRDIGRLQKLLIATVDAMRARRD